MPPTCTQWTGHAFQTAFAVAILLTGLLPVAHCRLPCNFTSRAEALDHCSQYEDLYQAIHDDVRPWARPAGPGIDKDLMRKAVMAHSVLGQRQKGVQLGFSGGRAYVIVGNLTDTPRGWVGHHANIFFTYMHVMLELEKLFGDAIPDVEFVITSGDKPMVMKQERLLALYGPKAGPANTPPTTTTTQQHLSSAVATLKQPNPSGVTARRLLSTDITQGATQKEVQQHVTKWAATRHTSGSNGGAGRQSQRTLLSEKASMKQVARRRAMAVPRQRGLAADGQQDGTRKRRMLRPKQKVINMNIPTPDLGTPLPVLRFCSSPAHADIRQPIFHFYTKKYAQRFLAKIPNITATYPWQTRKEVLFGRFAHYLRQVHPNVTETYRYGAKGKSICQLESRDNAVCWVRKHMFDVSAASSGQMDINSKPKINLSAHAQFKYLVHVDGQGLSSRLDQLLPLGSVVFKEESGYTTYYHHLLKPYHHYIPFWERDPLEALERIKWAKEHDTEARAIGDAGQQFAIRYLSKRARTCYWLKLLTEFSKLLTYKPSSGAGAMGLTWVPIEEYFETFAKKYEGGARFTPHIEQ